jgi:hypothetical protein
VVHVVVVVMMMMMMVMMVMMVMHGGSHRSGWRRRGFLRDGIAGEAEREHGGNGKGLDHEKVFLCFKGNPSGSWGAISLAA